MQHATVQACVWANICQCQCLSLCVFVCMQSTRGVCVQSRVHRILMNFRCTMMWPYMWKYMQMHVHITQYCASNTTAWLCRVITDQFANYTGIQLLRASLVLVAVERSGVLTPGSQRYHHGSAWFPIPGTYLSSDPADCIRGSPCPQPQQPAAAGESHGL